MKLQLESNNIEDYLKEFPPAIEFNTSLVQEKIKGIEAHASTLKERAKLAFEIARDEIQHSFDTGNQDITISAEDSLEKKKVSASQNHIYLLPYYVE